MTIKACCTLDLLRRTLSSCSQHIKETAYQTLDCPQIEYASEVWKPNTATENDHLQKIQINAARLVFCDYQKETHVTSLINQLNWNSLYTCRLIKEASTFTNTLLLSQQKPSSMFPACHTLHMSLDQRSIHFYKIHYRLVNKSPPACFQHATQISSRFDHPLKYINTVTPTINVYKYVSIRNRLPPSAVLHMTPSQSVVLCVDVPTIREMQPLFLYLPDSCTLCFYSLLFYCPHFGPPFITYFTSDSLLTSRTAPMPV